MEHEMIQDAFVLGRQSERNTHIQSAPEVFLTWPGLLPLIGTVKALSEEKLGIEHER